MIDINWLPDGGTGHMVANEEVISFWKNVKQKTDFKSIFEIGFNAGHSSSIILSLFDDVIVHSFDICMFDITKRNAKVVKNKFKDRFSFYEKNSMYLKPNEVDGYDVIFIDGSHDLPYIQNDLNLAFLSDVKYAIIDDLQNRNVKKTFQENKTKLKVVAETSYPASTGVNVPIKCCEIIR